MKVPFISFNEATSKLQHNEIQRWTIDPLIQIWERVLQPTSGVHQLSNEICQASNTISYPINKICQASNTISYL